MFNNGHEQQAKCPSQGLLRPGRFLWARAVPWSIVFGIVLWIAYKFVKDVGIASGLDGSSGVPTVLGVLAALALYVLSVRLIERRTPDELGLAQLAPELAAGIVLGVALFSAIMVVLLATGAYAMTGPTALRTGSISNECGDGIAGRRRTACTREASCLISCGGDGAHWNPPWHKYEVPMHTINVG